MLQDVAPIDILSSSAIAKFLKKAKLANVLIKAAHDSLVLRQKGVANLLESHFENLSQLVNNDSSLYTFDKKKFHRTRVET